MVEKPPYSYEKFGRCAGCGEETNLLRVYQPDVYCYRCLDCIPKMPPLPSYIAMEE